MKTANVFRSVVGAILLSASAAVVNAMPMVSVDPETSFGSVGDTLFVDLLWDGDGSQYIGDWDIDLTYDPTVVSYSGSEFHFGVDSFGCFICGDDSVPGLIDLYEVSFDFPADLIANQDSLGKTFKLATLKFTGIADGISPLLFSGLQTFGDENGDPFTPVLANGRICIGNVDCPVDVPEPTTLSIFLIGLAGLALRRKRGSGLNVA
ncbi:PEP-CTERM sorting domain-containing protein [Marinobacter sp. CHS3-4]|uniref:PEP-CTERM sorting domain-containing protein n=1 Tax=Marinobacter sp. CHS3-4 TaxID=3045174 RepID=UPI0024B60A50|nr:PEP-CTERM sorting domain-containing protein [Marinobacter sp. CHS3-4]MDI9246011.1 PEP-CTERM sorting domain-containing protein [Marinobacter sp. CHS3-4]